MKGAICIGRCSITQLKTHLDIMTRSVDNSKHVTIVGAGLAGCEAAWQLLTRGIHVKMIEMRPETLTPAHRSGLFAELVCSNSLRGAALTNAVGLLKEELNALGSLIMEAALNNRVPAGGALAVDRNAFSAYITNAISNHPLFKLEIREALDVPPSNLEAPVIVATGPLTSKNLAHAIRKKTGSNHLAFYDAISPIISFHSLDTEKMFYQSRYDKGSGKDYLNIPLDEQDYTHFVCEVLNGNKFTPHQVDQSDLGPDFSPSGFRPEDTPDGEDPPSSLKPFEGCMPIEDMCERGKDTLRYGPLKPMGLTNPFTGRRPHAVVQLRQDDAAGMLWSLVGMQTRLLHAEQTRIFRMLPGLENAEFVRLGSVHRNSFLNSPQCLDSTLQLRSESSLFFAGQLTGVEGYVESTASGMIAGINAARLVSGVSPLTFPLETAMGALINYISDPSRKDFQPMNISFGLIPSYQELMNDISQKRRTSKEAKRLLIAERSLAILKEFSATHGLSHD